MSLSVNLNGTLTLSATQRVTYPLTINYTMTGSHYVSANANVNTASWSVVDQQNNSNMYVGAFTNTDSTSSIYLITNNTGSQCFASILLPNSNCLLSYSGSTTVYAKASGSNPTPVLSYILMEA